MLHTRMSSKGQVVIPKELRDEMTLGSGADFEVRRNGEDEIVLKKVATPRRRATLEEVRRVGGMLKYKGPPVSVEDMNRAVDEMFRQKWRKT